MAEFGKQNAENAGVREAEAHQPVQGDSDQTFFSCLDSTGFFSTRTKKRIIFTAFTTKLYLKTSGSKSVEKKRILFRA